MKTNRRKCDSYKKEAYLAEIRKGVRRVQAAKNVGLNYMTIYRLTQSDPDFLKALTEAEVEACEPVVDALYQQALSGNMTAIIYWLQNRSPDQWQDKRNQPRIEVNNQPAPTPTVEELRAKLRSLLPNQVSITEVDGKSD